MPRNGAGVYNLVNNTWYPPVVGVLAQSTDWQTFIEDVGSALTQSVSKDGQTPMTGNLPMGNNKLTGLALGTANTDSASMANLNAVAGQAGGSGDRNLLVSGNFAINQRVYVSGAATALANQVTLDRWRVVTSGQSITFGAAAPDRVVTCPAGGLEQIIEGGWVVGGVYTLSWTGTATAKVNGVAIVSGGNTAVLPANAPISIQFASGTVDRAQFELGTAATPYQRRPPGVELALCMRDYQKSYALGTTPGTTTTQGAYFGTGNVVSTISANIRLGIALKGVASVQVWDINSNPNSLISVSAGGVQTTRSATASQQTESSFNINSGALATDVLITGHWAAFTGL